MKKWLIPVLALALLTPASGNAQAATKKPVVKKPSTKVVGISAQAQQKNAKVMTAIKMAIQLFDAAEVGAAGSFNSALASRDAALATVLIPAWDPNASSPSSYAVTYAPLVNTWMDAQSAATKAIASENLTLAQYGIADRAYNFAQAQAAYQFKVKLSQSTDSPASKAKTLALFNAQSAANAKARADREAASIASMRAAAASYSDAADAARNAFVSTFHNDESGNFYLFQSQRAMASEAAIKAFDTASVNAKSAFDAAERANLSQLVATLTSLATSLPKLAKSADDALASAYSNAANP